MTDLYAILGLAETATAAQIKTTWKRLAKATHPDVCADPEAADRFTLISSAYEVLGDPEKRATYDRTRHRVHCACGRVVGSAGATCASCRATEQARRAEQEQARRHHERVMQRHEIQIAQLRRESYRAEQARLEAEYGHLGHYGSEGLPRGCNPMDFRSRRRYGLRTWKVA